MESSGQVTETYQHFILGELVKQHLRLEISLRVENTIPILWSTLGVIFLGRFVDDEVCKKRPGSAGAGQNAPFPPKPNYLKQT